MVEKERIEEVRYNYLVAEHDLHSLLQLVEELEDYYDEGGKQEIKRHFHIVRRVLEVARSVVREANRELEELYD